MNRIKNFFILWYDVIVLAKKEEGTVIAILAVLIGWFPCLFLLDNCDHEYVDMSCDPNKQCLECKKCGRMRP